MKKIETIIEKQKDFQRMVGFPIDSVLESDRNEMSEKFIFKLIEEAVELRKEFPSAINPWSKSQKNADIRRIKEELSDLMMFLINILVVWKLSFSEMVEMLEFVQSNNFEKIKSRKMQLLNSDILKIPSRVAGVGQGNLTPRFVFVGQNPGQGITQGYKFWSDPLDGSSRTILPALSGLNVLHECYFTNIVKCITEKNEEPGEILTDFYFDFFEKELEILKFNNKNMVILTMGNWADGVLTKRGIRHLTIKHPAFVLQGGISQNEYTNEIKNTIAHLT